MKFTIPFGSIRQSTVTGGLSAAFADSLQYPATLAALWQHAVGQTRYAWSGAVPNGSAVIDAYPGVATLDMLAKRGRGVKIELVTHSNGICHDRRGRKAEFLV